MKEYPRPSGVRAGAPIALFATLVLVLAGCSGAGASTVPTIPAGVPTIPAGVPTVPPSGLTSACLDSDTMAIVDQLKATGADTPTILAANKDKLVAGLNRLQPSDPAVVAWRDSLVTAINSNDAQAVAAQIALLSNGQVTIPPC
jgi:hypothetical protein